MQPKDLTEGFLKIADLLYQAGIVGQVAAKSNEEASVVITTADYGETYAEIKQNGVIIIHSKNQGDIYATIDEKTGEVLLHPEKPAK